MRRLFRDVLPPAFSLPPFLYREPDAKTENTRDDSRSEETKESSFFHLAG